MKGPVGPVGDKPLTLRGQDEAGQWMMTIYPDRVELALRAGDNDTWGFPVHFAGREVGHEVHR